MNFFSFHSLDDYYSEQAAQLKKCLEDIGVRYHLEAVEIEEGKDWPDVCRLKVPLLRDFARQCAGEPVFWIDCDCRLEYIPEYLKKFTADIIGFQRGFGVPKNIGYGVKNRFWEPCFIGFSGSEKSLEFLDLAAALERDSKIRATDDYFFEEAWRQLSDQLSYQFIPSSLAVLPSKTVRTPLTEPFFRFGASGNVPMFKDKVEQHKVDWMPRDGVLTAISSAPKKALKKVFFSSKGVVSSTLERIAPTKYLEAKQYYDAAKHRILYKGVNGSALLSAASSGDERKFWSLRKNSKFYEQTNAGRDCLRLANSFRHFRSCSEDKEKNVNLLWWSRPAPGNFGDWLSPYLFQKTLGVNIHYVRPESIKRDYSHYVGVGSVAKFAVGSSIVVGSGVSRVNTEMCASADYRMVRGPLTKSIIEKSGGNCAAAFGDPGVLLPLLYQPRPKAKLGRYLLVRHFSHMNVKLSLGKNVDEASILVSHPAEIERFIDTLHQYDGIVTSAMHCHICCQAYGIPSRLIVFEGAESLVSGDGMKYEDYALGVDLTYRKPLPVGSALTTESIEAMLLEEYVSQAVIARVHGDFKSSLGAAV